MAYDGGTGRPAGDEPLPDFTGVELDTLRAVVSHPVLGALLASLSSRARNAHDVVAFFEDGPTA